VNLGNPHEVTIRGLAETIVDMTGSQSKLVARPLPEDDPRQRCPDISLAQGKLAWSPTTSLQDGLKATISYFDDLLSER
jgi:UDP-glucuronate decarboxylase